MKIPDLRTGPGPDLIPPKDHSLSVGDLVRAAAHLGRAFPIWFFPNPDAGPTRFVVVDCSRHFDAVPCECGERPSIIYSTDRNGGMTDDGMAWVAISCDSAECREKNGAITVFTHKKMFSRARGAMGSVVRSWWNAMRDRDGHADDMGQHEGMLVGWEDFSRYMSGGANAATAPAEPGNEEG